MFQQEFHCIICQAGAGDQRAEALWSAIRGQYNAPGRFYHNLSHLDQVISQLVAVKDQVQNWTAVVMATAYHDYVYDPLRTDNEEQSALCAEQELSAVIDAASLALCLRMVRATKTHLPDPHTDLNFFIDADLSILGAPAREYQFYSRQIKKEYSMFAGAVYHAGRRKVLQQFLDRKRIFNSSYFYEHYEVRARENLRAELALLKSEAGEDSS